MGNVQSFHVCTKSVKVYCDKGSANSIANAHGMSIKH